MQATMGSLFRPTADRQRLFRFAPVFILASMGTAIGPAAYMALFNERLGSEYLPLTFAATAVALLAAAVLMSALSSRFSSTTFNQGFFIIISTLVLGTGLILLTRPPAWFYVVLLIISDTVIETHNIQLWTAALAACDTQQAKRLFPMLTAVSVLGSIAGGFLAGPLSQILSTEGVYLTWGGLLVLTTVAQIPIARTYLRLSQGETTQKQAGLVRNFDYLRKTPFLLVMVTVITLLLGLLYLSYYNFYYIADLQFADEESAAGFFGLFAGLYETFALLISLALTGLLNRWGVARISILIAGICVVGFGLMLPAASQLTGGIALVLVFVSHLLIKNAYTMSEPLTRVIFKVIPPQMDGVRLLIEGVAGLFGMLLGALLSAMHSSLGVDFGALMGVGISISAVFLVLALSLNRMYLQALLEALIAGRADLVADLPEWLGKPTEAMLAMLRNGLRSRNPGVREITLQTLERVDAPDTLRDVLPMLTSENPNVRYGAIRAAVALAASKSAPLNARPTVIQGLRETIWESPPEMRGRIFLGLEKLDAPERNDRMLGLRNMLDSLQPAVRAAGIDALADGNLTELAPNLLPLVDDENARLRARAIHALGKLSYDEAIPRLLGLLPRADRITRAALIEAFSQFDHIDPLIEALDTLPIQAQADLLSGLAQSPHTAPHQKLLENIVLHELGRVRDWPLHEVEPKDLRALLHNRLVEIKAAVSDAALTLLGRFTDSGAVAIIRRHLAVDDIQERANALEALDSIGERRISIALMASYHNGAAYDEHPRPITVEMLETVNDPWVRALIARIFEHKSHDTQEFIMFDQTLDFDRILMLKQVPLFHQLSLNELQVIAAATTEEKFEAGKTLMRQGERGDKLFILVKGKVLVNIDGEGEEAKTIASHGGGSVVGEMSLLDDEPRSATVVAAELTHALTLERDAFKRLLYQYPEIADSLLRELVRRLRARDHVMMP